MYFRSYSDVLLIGYLETIYLRRKKDSINKIFVCTYIVN